MSSIILVDDEKDLCDSLARLLKREFPNTTIQHSVNPIEAREWLKQERPKLLITDVRMPGLSGLELLSHVSELWGVVPTIVMTAFASPEVDKGVELGNFHYLPKPFRNKELIDLIKKITENGDHKSKGFAGTIAVPMLADIVQLHSLAGSTGILVVETNQLRGEIHFSKGRIVHATDGTNKGREAFNQILSWQSGQFHLLRQPVNQLTIHIPSSELLIDALRIADEQARQHTELDGNTSDSFEKLFAEFQSADSLEQASFVQGQQPNNPPQVSVTGSFSQPSLPTQTMAPVHNLKKTTQKLEEIIGLINACIGDFNRQEILASVGPIEQPWKESLEAHRTALHKKQEVIEHLGMDETISDIVILSKDYYQVLLVSQQYEGIYFSVLLDRHKANLALARLTLSDVEAQLVLSTR